MAARSRSSRKASRSTNSMFRILLVLALVAAQEDKKAPPDPKPRISMAIRLSVEPGATSKITILGSKLATGTEIKLAERIEGASVVVKSKRKAEMPNESGPALYGDTKADLEVTLPAEPADGKLSLIAVNAAAATAPYEVA